MKKPKYPPIGSKVKCLKIPRWPTEISEKMVGQAGTVDRHYPEDSQYGACLSIQYLFSPFPDNRITHTLSDEDVTWERIEP